MSKTEHDATPQGSTGQWITLAAKFRQSSNLRAIWQLTNTLLPYAALWYAMYRLSLVSWWLVVPCAVLAAALLVRLFIIFHDCGHGSFFSSRRANAIVGFITGTLTFVPTRYWWAEHAAHHAAAGNLDRRGIGDIWTLTVREYLEASRWRRFAYRLTRNPLVLFVIAPVFLFVVKYRFATRDATAAERRSILWANIAISAMVVSLGLLMGFSTYLLIQALVMVVSGAAGVWLFYVQHQFDGVYWERGEDWNYSSAALQGSSYYKLPRVLQWFSGNIGFHHIHHLNPGIPNYHLERCHRSVPDFGAVKPLTLRSSLRSLGFRLWDDKLKRLVGYPAMS
jgi:omega-6 fatty acid desaturase (delta-12 desaturase)